MVDRTNRHVRWAHSPRYNSRSLARAVANHSTTARRTEPFTASDFIFGISGMFSTGVPRVPSGSTQHAAPDPRTGASAAGSRLRRPPMRDDVRTTMNYAQGCCSTSAVSHCPPVHPSRAHLQVLAPFSAERSNKNAFTGLIPDLGSSPTLFHGGQPLVPATPVRPFIRNSDAHYVNSLSSGNEQSSLADSCNYPLGEVTRSCHGAADGVAAQNMHVAMPNILEEPKDITLLPAALRNALFYLAMTKFPKAAPVVRKSYFLPPVAPDFANRMTLVLGELAHTSKLQYARVFACRSILLFCLSDRRCHRTGGCRVNGFYVGYHNAYYASRQRSLPCVLLYLQTWTKR